jgi:hypothetical protein
MLTHLCRRLHAAVARSVLGCYCGECNDDLQHCRCQQAEQVASAAAAAAGAATIYLETAWMRHISGHSPEGSAEANCNPPDCRCGLPD